MAGNMLRQRSFIMMKCLCNHHHKPTLPWRKRERRRARAREKQRLRKDMDNG